MWMVLPGSVWGAILCFLLFDFFSKKMKRKMRKANEGPP